MISNFNQFLNENNKWSIEKLQDEVNKYETRNEFLRKNNRAYFSAANKGLLDELFKNHKNQGLSIKRKKNGYWTKEKLQEEANKYETRNEFFEKNNSAYSIAYKTGIINDIFRNHINQGYIDKDEWKENNYVIYVYELPIFNKAYIGLTNNMKRRDREHLFTFKTALNKFCKENNISLPQYKILESDLNSIKAKKREEYWIDLYKNNNWEIFNIAKAGSLGGFDIKWKKKTLQQEADKYKTRGEFKYNNSPAYQAAREKGLLDEIFKNHINQGYSEKNKKSGYWTEEKLQNEVEKYKTRNEFKQKNKKAHQAAVDKGLLDKLFQNHQNKGYITVPNGYWTEENLQDDVKKYKTRREFELSNKGGYKAAIDKKILDKLFQNHINQGYKYKIKNKNKL